MAVTHRWYGKGLLSVMNKEVDWVGDDLQVTLHTSTYAPNLDTHDYYDDLTDELATAGGYTNGGHDLTTEAAAFDAGTDEARFDADDFVIATATFTCRYAVVRVNTGVAATSPLISLVDFGADQSPVAQEFRIAWASTGVVLLRSVAA